MIMTKTMSVTINDYNDKDKDMSVTINDSNDKDKDNVCFN